MDFIEKGSKSVSIITRIKSELKLNDSRKETEELLQNILPLETIIELKENQKAIPKKYEHCSVIFTDFVDFSTVSKDLSPNDMVNVLNFYFTAFDKICDKWNVEKIKTIGDYYMCISGTAKDKINHAQNIIHAAIEIIQFTLNVPPPLNVKKWECRIGISSGELVAGVIGEKKIAYDVWGDTVNIASRKESSSRPNEIKIASHTYTYLNEDFKLENIET